MQLNRDANASYILYVEKIDDGSRHFDKLFTLWNEIRQIPKEDLDITVDFHYCDFLAHNGVAFLGGLVRFVELQGGRVHFDWATLCPKVRMNLAQNGFLCDFGQTSEPWDGNSIPYRCDSHPNEQAVAGYLQDKWLGKGWVNISPELKDAITGQALEIYLNAFEHSQSQIGVFSCGQHYPKMGILQLMVVDFGVGIVANVRSLPQNSTMSAAQALEWAFQPGNSTKQSEGNRGIGLNLLQEFVIRNRGELMIFSGDGCAVITHNGVVCDRKNIDFAGTLINISLRCDESYYCLSSEVIEPKKTWF